MSDCVFQFINGTYQKDQSHPGVLADSVSWDGAHFTLHLPSGFSAKAPIYLRHVHTDSNQQVHSVSHHITAGEHARAVLVASYQGDNALTYTHHINTRIDLESSAHIHFYKWQQESAHAFHQAHFIAEQASDSYLATYQILNRVHSSEDDFLYLLKGERARCESIGLCQSNNKQHMQINSHIQHLNSFTHSRQLYKGIAADQSYVRFKGLVTVNSGLKAVCAHQKNQNLLLSSQARVDAQPELIIYSEDVRCSHGATIGQLDKEALFYLQSRGIDRPAANALLTQGFAHEIFDSFPDRDVATMMMRGPQ